MSAFPLCRFFSIRIYFQHLISPFTGNVDLKATFKTVALKKDMLVTDLIQAALKKFRVPDAKPEEFYIGVLHMDSRMSAQKRDIYNANLRGTPHTRESSRIATHRISAKQGQLAWRGSDL